MESTTGIIPEELHFPQKKKEVIAFLLAQPYTGDFKRRLLEGWAVTVGLRLRGNDYARVERSGIDYPAVSRP
jgi:hypothetical protein